MDLEKDSIKEQVSYVVKSLKYTMQENPAVAALSPSDAYLKSNDEVDFILPVKTEHTNTHGIVHGGIFVMLLDTVMGYACHFKTGCMPVVTLNMSTSFIANCFPGSTVTATGRTVHVGRRVVVAEGTVYDETGKLLCTAQGTFFVKGNGADKKTKN